MRLKFGARPVPISGNLTILSSEAIDGTLFPSRDLLAYKQSRFGTVERAEARASQRTHESQSENARVRELSGTAEYGTVVLLCI